VILNDNHYLMIMKIKCELKKKIDIEDIGDEYLRTFHKNLKIRVNSEMLSEYSP
jgi:hypothetical protein